MPKQMTKAERAAYMRDYRARKAAPVNPEVASTTPPGLLLPGLGMGTPGPAAADRPKPAFLAAPDDDCPACHHDRQESSHLGGQPCKFKLDRRRACGCTFWGF